MFELTIYKVGYWRNGVFYEADSPCATIELAQIAVITLNKMAEEKCSQDHFTYLPCLVRTK